MSFLKKISCLLFAIIAIAGGIKITSAEVVNVPVVQRPEIYIKDLVLNSSQFNAGDTVKGSFTAYNTRDTGASDVYYEIWLAGNYQKNGLASDFYDSKKIGPVYFTSNESKKVDFSYVLPNTVAGDNLGIEIKAVLGTGAPMGWADAMIKVAGNMELLKITDAFVQSNGVKFTVQAGPTLKPEKVAFLEVDLKNTLSSSVSFIPEIKIYRRGANNILASDEKLGSETIISGAVKQIKYNLPSFNDTSGVYVGEVSFLDSNNNIKAQSFEFRYIISGDLVTIQNLSVDKLSVIAGDEITGKLQYTGSSLDIEATKFATSTPAIYTLNVKLISETGVIVGTYSDKFDFNVGTEKVFIIKSLASARGLSSEVTVMNGNKIVAQYKSIFPVATENQDQNAGFNGLSLIYKMITLIVALAFIIIAWVLVMKKKHLALFIVLLILFGVSFGTKADAYVAISKSVQSSWPMPPNISLSVSNPTGTHTIGQQYQVSGSVWSDTCNNLSQRAIIYVNLTANTSCQGGSWTAIADIYNIHNWGPDSHWYNSNNFASGNYNVPATAGAAYVCVKAEAYQYNQGSGESQWAATEIGRQDFTVINPAAPTLTAVTSTTCGGNISLSWNSTGANNYKIFKNGTLLATTTNTTYGLAASSTDTFTVKGTFGSTDSASSNSVSATPSVACLPAVPPPGGGNGGGGSVVGATGNGTVVGQPGYCGGNIYLTWAAITGASKYHIYESNGTTEVASTTSTSAVVKSAPNSNKSYKLKSENSTGVLSTSFSTTTPSVIVSSDSCPPPELSITDTLSTCDNGDGNGRHALVTWTTNVVNQSVSRKEYTSDGSWTSFHKISPDFITSPYLDTNLSSGIQKVQYQIQATSSDGAASNVTGNQVSVYGTCAATKINCSILGAGVGKTIPVNTNVIWNASRVPVGSLSGYMAKWTITENGITNSSLYNSATNAFGHIFTTIGPKTLDVVLTGANSWGNCSATTTVNNSGGIGEQ